MDNTDSIKSVTTRMPPGLYDDFAIEARRRGMPIKEAFQQAVERWLQLPPPVREYQAPDDLLAAFDRLISAPKTEKDTFLREYLVSLLKSDYSKPA